MPSRAIPAESRNAKAPRKRKVESIILPPSAPPPVSHALFSKRGGKKKEKPPLPSLLSDTFLWAGAPLQRGARTKGKKKDRWMGNCSTLSCILSARKEGK